MNFRIVLLAAVLGLLETADAVSAALPDTSCAKALSARHFVFHAQWATSFTGTRHQLTPSYDLVVSPDSVSAYLPYYGRLYTTPTPEELQFMSIHFVSRKFDYKLGKDRKRQELTMSLKDVHDLQLLSISMAQSCWSTLWISSAGRDPISYEGTIETLP